MQTTSLERNFPYSYTQMTIIIKLLESAKCKVKNAISHYRRSCILNLVSPFPVYFLLLPGRRFFIIFLRFRLISRAFSTHLYYANAPWTVPIILRNVYRESEPRMKGSVLKCAYLVYSKEARGFSRETF